MIFNSITNRNYFYGSLILSIFLINSVFSQEELLVKRKAIYEFTKNPTISKKDDKIFISFTSKGYCDVTIAIENSNGKIIRHLISGVLGKNAPAPFKKDALSQTVEWDSKDDQGKYVLSYDNLSVRVSLGINPKYEKDLYWDPQRRQGREAPILKATKEGVYVYDGGMSLDFVKLFNANGDYVKTVYPFPGNTIKKVKGLHLRKMVDGVTLPIKPTYLQQTFLTSGNYYGYKKRKKEFSLPKKVNIKEHHYHYGMKWYASSILAVKNKKIALGMDYLFRFATDGTSGGMDVSGPVIALSAPRSKYANQSNIHMPIMPRSGALSPDGKILYLTAYHFCRFGRASADIILPGTWHTFHGVFKMELESNQKPVLFAGSDIMDKAGADEKSFNVPAHVATDNKGNVYISDHLNHRIQIFSSTGKLIKTLKVPNPSQVAIEPNTQKIYAVSSMIYVDGLGNKKRRMKKVENKITVFSASPDFKQESALALPNKFNKWIVPHRYRGNFGFPLSVAVLKNNSETNIWISREWIRENVINTASRKKTNIHIFTIKGKTLVLKKDFEKSVLSKNMMTTPVKYARQRLNVNPVNQKLYLTESGSGQGMDKVFKIMREIDPNTGKVRVLDLPFDAMDMCFDHDGYIYLRNTKHVVRYDMSKSPWREVPWDYGIEVKRVFSSSSSLRKETSSVSALTMTGSNGGWHHGGMFVALNGNIVVGNLSWSKENSVIFPFKNYEGRSFIGRGGTPFINVWDKYGKILQSDFIPGLAGNTYGVGLDKNNNIYIMSSGTRVYNNKRHYNNLSGTVMKFSPKKGKVLSAKTKNIPLKLDPANYLKRSYDLNNAAFGNAWVIGSEWMYGGVGWSGKNEGKGCSCPNARFMLDYFNRSFAPEVDRFSIAMLDSAGNLITRIGTYGNADAQGPGSKAPVGGDGIGLMHGAYVAIDTDRRLFIADPANQKIISATLGYHKEERVSLKKFQREQLGNKK